MSVSQQVEAGVGGSSSDATSTFGRPLQIALALLAVYFIWGSTYLGIRVSLEGFPPFRLAALRFLVAGLVLYLILRARGVPPPTRREWIGAAAIGTLLLLGGNGLVTFAQQWVASGIAAIAVATVPLWSALFAGLFDRWPTMIETAGVAVGFAGVALLNLEGDLRASPVGAVALVLAALSWSFGSIWSRRIPLPVGMMASAAQMLAGGVALALVSLAVGERMAELPSLRPAMGFVYLTVFGSLVGYSAYAYLLREVRPAVATSYAYVNPIVAVALGALLAGERLSGIGLAALVTVLGGVALVLLGREHSR